MSRDASVDRPIFIVGPPRSGTSLLYKILARHPDLAWFNRNHKRLPEWPRLARFLTAIRNQPDVPQESSAVWNRFCTGDDDCLAEADATPEVRAWYRGVVAGLTAARGRPRFLAKLPAHSLRVAWLDAIFPDALFVVVVRDWRAVASSMVEKRRSDLPAGSPWIGVHIPGWRDALKLAPEAFAARQFRVVHETIEAQLQRFPERSFRVFYEGLCDEPAATIRDLIDWCGLRWTEAFAASLPSDLVARNQAWRRALGTRRVAELRASEGPGLARFEEPFAALR